MAKSNVTIGLLLCGNFNGSIIKKHGNYADLYKDFLSTGDFNFNYKEYNVFDNELPKSADECDAWLITGSKKSVYENLPWISNLKQHIRNCSSMKVPVIGICFGHQLMAEALGGKVELAKNGWGIGRHCYLSSNNLDIQLNAMHKDQVIIQPPKSIRYAASDFCPIGALHYPGFGFSIQLHPEFSQDFLIDLINNRRGISFSNDIANKALEKMTDMLDYSHIRTAKFIAGFIQGKGKLDSINIKNII